MRVDSVGWGSSSVLLLPLLAAVRRRIVKNTVKLSNDETNEKENGSW